MSTRPRAVTRMTRRSLDRERSRRPPGEQGNASAAVVIGSGQKTTTGHAKSGLPESESARDVNGSDPKIATGHGRTATEKTTASDSLARSTANGKRSESENGLHDPSLFLDLKIEKHRRIVNGSGPPKHLSAHHVAERAVMSGEKQPRKQRGQGESAANEQPPPLQLPKELKRQRLARGQPTNVQRHFHPSRWTEVKREGRKPHGTQHQVHPETPSSHLAPLKGGKKRRKSRAAELSKKFPRGEKPQAQREQSLKGMTS